MMQQLKTPTVMIMAMIMMMILLHHQKTMMTLSFLMYKICLITTKQKQSLQRQMFACVARPPMPK